MNKSKLFLIILMLFVFQQYGAAQKKVKGSVKGVLIDTVYNESMANATISVIESSDSSLVSHTLADPKGAFTIRDLNEGVYRLLISFQGYEMFQKKLSISAASPQIDLGTINMIRAVICLTK